MVAAPCQMQWGWGQRSQEAQVWLLQTQLSQMEWMCSQVATVSSVYTICNCRNCWFCHFRAPRMTLSSWKTGKCTYRSATANMIFVCPPVFFLHFLKKDINWVVFFFFTTPFFPVQTKSLDLCHPSSKNLWLTFIGKQAERQRYTCRVSCSIHVTFTVTHIKEERGGFSGESECQK